MIKKKFFKDVIYNGKPQKERFLLCQVVCIFKVQSWSFLSLVR